MKSLYGEIKARLESKLPDLWVDLFCSQFDNDNENSPLLLPCCFIEIGTVVWQPKRSPLGRIGAVNGRIHVGQDFYSDTFKDAADFFSLVNAVALAIELFEGEFFTPLVLTNTVYDDRYKHMLVHVIEFRTTYTDSGQFSDYITKPKPNQEIIINNG